MAYRFCDGRTLTQTLRPPVRIRGQPIRERQGTEFVQRAGIHVTLEVDHFPHRRPIRHPAAALEFRGVGEIEAQLLSGRREPQEKPALLLADARRHESLRTYWGGSRYRSQERVVPITSTSLGLRPISSCNSRYKAPSRGSPCRTPPCGNCQPRPPLRPPSSKSRSSRIRMMPTLARNP